MRHSAVFPFLFLGFELLQSHCVELRGPVTTLRIIGALLGGLLLILGMQK